MRYDKNAICDKNIYCASSPFSSNYAIDRSKLRSKFPISLGTGRWHFILFDSDGESCGEQMAPDNDVCEKETQLARKHLFAGGSSS